jgi:N-acetylmuramoyl-L-alanine amidase CwlA
MAGVCSVEDFGNIVAPTSRQMSANYAIGNDGRIGLFCPESDRSWCTSSPYNDNRAITIEVSNSAAGGDWPIGDKAYNSLIKLCVDICKRNGIKKLYYDGTNGTLTRHCDYASTLCPGPWMKNHTTDLCNKVNAQLNSTTDTPKPTTPSTQPSSSSFKVNDLVSINAGARYYNGGGIPAWVSQEKWYISSISGNRAVLGLNEAKNRNIQSPINTKDITLVKTQTSTFKEYTKSLKGTDKIYGTAGGTVVGTIGTSGVYTIVDEKTVGTVTYGKLKSGKGWVIVRQQDIQLKKGDKVKVLNPIIYGTNKKFTVFVSVYTVLEVNGDRVVISSDGKNVTTAIAKSNLQKV